MPGGRLSVEFAQDPQTDALSMHRVRSLTEQLLTRGTECAAHLARVSALTVRLAELAGLDHHETTALRLASTLHDVGKLRIASSLLDHEGVLTPAQRETMRQHTRLGHDLCDGPGPLLQLAATTALTHHERWDGFGYPFGLVGIAIPLESRIVAIADVFDALCSPRHDRTAMSTTQAAGYLVEEAGGHFDPELVARFIDDFAQMEAIVSGGRAVSPEPILAR